jgi:hypothetical protein
MRRRRNSRSRPSYRRSGELLHPVKIMTPHIVSANVLRSASKIPKRDRNLLPGHISQRTRPLRARLGRCSKIAADENIVGLIQPNRQNGHKINLLPIRFIFLKINTFIIFFSANS